LRLSLRAPLAPLFPYTTLFRSHALLAIHQCGLLARTCFTWSTVISPPLLSQLFRIKVMTLATCSSVRFIAGITLLKDSPLTLIGDRKSTRLNSSHVKISYAVFC